MPVIKGFKVGSETFKYEDQNIAEEFSETKTYAVGVYVINPEDGLLYRCHTAITTGGDWTGAANWINVKGTGDTDTTLLTSGMAADAKIVGDNISNFNDFFHNEVENLIDITLAEPGYYTSSGLQQNGTYYHQFISCSSGDIIYTNAIWTNATITFFNNNKKYIMSLAGGFTPTENKNWFKVPNNSNIAYFSFPMNRELINTQVVTKNKIPWSYKLGYSCAYQTTSTNNLYNKIVLASESQDMTHISLTNYKNNALVKFINITSGIGWTAFLLHSMQAVFSMRGFLIVARNSKYYIAFGTALKTLYRMPIDGTVSSNIELATFEEKINLPSPLQKKFISLTSYGKVYAKELNTGVCWDIDISPYIDESYIMGLGFMVSASQSVYNNVRGMVYEETEIIPETYYKPAASYLGDQWRGKKWYAYGTSVTNVSSEGKYANFLRDMSKMTLYNKGISGGGIGNFGGTSTGQVYNAICNITDGKLEADLITLETGANDTGAATPLGTIYDTGTSTLSGCLNDCLRYLQENTDAQIVVMCSPASKTIPTAESHKYYEWAQMVEQICYLNRVHFINSNNNMGCAKLASDKGTNYIVDNIHQTDLGGYIYAQNIWYQLRNIPLFYTTMPES